MNITIFGTGGVGQTLAAKLASLGHAVMIGTRDPQATHQRPEFAAWQAAHPAVSLGTFAQAGAHGALAINALAGHASLAGLAQAEADLAGKIVIDLSNPLDFSNGMPPSLFVGLTDSLGEQIQRLLPTAKVVKTLNTVNSDVMVNPAQVANGDHVLYIGGNDPEAKATVMGYLREWFGWQHLLDLGGIETSRATEAAVLLWVQVWGKLGTAHFNFKIVQ
jgi:8-hydroxy-5-deazaflavin:NADPH oxidoreductase